MTNAIGYIRVSTKRQGRSGLGLEAQQTAINQFAASENLTVVEWHEDIESGANSVHITVDHERGFQRNVNAYSSGT
jgi:DNA invertase Pin-like site-specific DNA recombinase